MDPRALVAIADYLGRINNMVWTFVSTRPEQLPAVHGLLIGIMENVTLGVGHNCTRPDDCDQGEACIDGTCIPRESGLNLAFHPVGEPLPRLGPVEQAAIEEGLTKIFDRLARALTRDPKQLYKARVILMDAYASALRLTCAHVRKCDSPCECEPGHACVDGICVPVPFHLKYRAAHLPPTPPWTA